jgi:hypothetical protein
MIDFLINADLITIVTLVIAIHVVGWTIMAKNLKKVASHKS